MTALGFSEHGSVFSWLKKKEAIEAAGMKYIHASEFYITERLYLEDGVTKIRDNWHCVLIAKNDEGFKELNRLSSISFNRGDGHYYYVPRITLEELFGTSENILITSACLGGLINKSSSETRQRIIEFFAQNRHRCFLEIQHHDVEEQIQYNRMLLKLSQRYKIPLIAGTDTHALNAEHLKGRAMLQKAKGICFGEEDGWDLSFKSYDELVKAYEKQNALPMDLVREAIENTNRMADLVEVFDIDRSLKYPHIYDDPENVFKQKIQEGLERNPYLNQRYSQEQLNKKIQEEFEVYKKIGMFDFLLLEVYMREWEHKNGIFCGPGRGSVSGSELAYILGITEMDSLKFGLNFFRFANPDRVSLGDIDTDYGGKDRDRVKYFLLHDHMNLKNIQTSEIITFNTIKTKGAIKDIGRALKLSLELTQEISDAVTVVDGKEVIDDKYRKEYRELFEYVDIVTGTIVSIGSHPSGVLVSDRNINEETALCSLATSDYPVSQIYMKELDALNFVKLDILGLDNVAVINEACDLAGIERLTPDNTPLDDEAVWKSIRDDTTLIFQWESESAAQFLKSFMSEDTLRQVKSTIKDFQYIKWFSFGNGLLRPACESYRDLAAIGKPYDNGLKELNEFLAPTLGYLTMQEDIMMFLVRFCGYSGGESDSVRRAIAKKNGTEQLLPEIRRRFIEYTSQTYNVPKEMCMTAIEPFLQVIKDASAYGFSWNHSDAYSCIGYICGYLRYYHPLEFLTAAFNAFGDNNEKLVNITAYAKRVGIEIKPIQFRHSRGGYFFDKQTRVIYKGIATIKYLNETVANELYGLRDRAFHSFTELLEVLKEETSINSRQLEILIRLDLFSEFGEITQLLVHNQLFLKLYNKKQLKKAKLAEWGYSEAIMKGIAVKETQEVYKDFDYKKVVGRLLAATPCPPLSIGTFVADQLEYLGYIDYVNPDLDPRYCVVTELNTTYSPKFVGYCLATGQQKEFKIHKRLDRRDKRIKNCFADTPVADKDVIYINSVKKTPRQKKGASGWETVPGVYDTWINDYSKVTLQK